MTEPRVIWMSENGKYRVVYDPVKLDQAVKDNAVAPGVATETGATYECLTTDALGNETWRDKGAVYDFSAPFEGMARVLYDQQTACRVPDDPAEEAATSGPDRGSVR